MSTYTVKLLHRHNPWPRIWKKDEKIPYISLLKIDFYIYWFRLYFFWLKEHCQSKVEIKNQLWLHKDSFIAFQKFTINPNWHEGGTFHPLSFSDQILSAAFLSNNSKLFFEMKINQVNLTPCHANWVLLKNVPRWR